MRYVVRVKFDSRYYKTYDYYVTSNNNEKPLVGDHVLISTAWGIETSVEPSRFFTECPERQTGTFSVAVIVDVLNETDNHSAVKEVLIYIPMAKLRNKDANRIARATEAKKVADAMASASRKAAAKEELAKELVATVLDDNWLNNLYGPPTWLSAKAQRLISTIKGN